MSLSGWPCQLQNALRTISRGGESHRLKPLTEAFVAAGSHELVYETQHTKLLQASAEWLRFGAYDGRSRGSSSK